MTTDIDTSIRRQLNEIVAEHESRIGAIDPTDPLAPNTAMRLASSTRTHLRNLRSTAPIGSDVADAIVATETSLVPGLLLNADTSTDVR